jgi:hypothetical protein
MLLEWEVTESGSGSFPVAIFGFSSVENLFSNNSVLFN